MTTICGPLIPLLVLVGDQQCSGATCDEGFTCSTPFGCEDYIQIASI